MRCTVSETEAGSLADSLGREERLKDALLNSRAELRGRCTAISTTTQLSWR